MAAAAAAVAATVPNKRKAEPAADSKSKSAKKTSAASSAAAAAAVKSMPSPYDIPTAAEATAATETARRTLDLESYRVSVLKGIGRAIHTSTKHALSVIHLHLMIDDNYPLGTVCHDAESEVGWNAYIQWGETTDSITDLLTDTLAPLGYTVKQTRNGQEIYISIRW